MRWWRRLELGRWRWQFVDAEGLRSTFKAVKTGSSTVTLNYLRPFEQGVPPVQTEDFDVTVK
jgi:hypothetical protein